MTQRIDPKDIMSSACMPDLDLLSLIADWKQSLRNRIAQAELIFELVDTNVDFAPLVLEVEQFSRCCRALAWRPQGKFQ
jgi:hypothetical protein